MKTLALSGWGQPHDALKNILPEATHVDYAIHKSVETALSDIADIARGYELVAGWSLGGQLAVRAIATGLIMPQKLVLISVPFQFVEVEKNGLGMKRDTFEVFCNNFLKNPLRTLSKAWDLLHYQDSHSQRIANQLASFSKDAVLARNWLNWLSLIDGYSCEALNFSTFPPTLLVHGEKDKVVEPEQSVRFAKTIANAKLVTWPACGHAPHWHDAEGLMQLIKEHLHV